MIKSCLRLAALLFGLGVAHLPAFAQIYEQLPPQDVNGCASIVTFGASPSSSDNSGAINTALAARMANGSTNVCITIPVGKFPVASRIAYTIPAGAALTIYGAGSDLSTLVWPNANGGIAITKSGCSNSVHIRDLTLSTQQVGGGTGLAVTGACTNGTTQPTNDLVRVTDRGDNGPGGTNYWTTGFLFTNDSYWNLVSDTDQGPLNGSYATATSGGTGVSLVGATHPVGVVYNLSGFTSNYRSTALSYGANIQGVTVSGGSNFTACYNGVVVPSDLPAGNDQLDIGGSAFNCMNAAVIDSSGVRATNIHDNLIIVPGASSIGIDLVKYSFAKILGNEIAAATGGSGTGIVFGTPFGIQQSLVDGNAFATLATGVNINSTATGILIGHANTYAGATTPIVNSNASSYVNAIDILSDSLYSQYSISAAASGTGGVVRLTANSTASLVGGAFLWCNLTGTSPLVGFFPVQDVVDATHFELATTSFAATLTGTCFWAP